MSTSLPFPLIARIQDALAGAGAAALTDLVMILPQGEDILAIYNGALPQALPPGWQAQPLDAVSDEDILEHEGLILACSGLDAYFPSLVLYGPTFYNLHRIFVDLGQIPLGMKTAYNLAQTLWQADWTPKGAEPRGVLWRETRMVQLALPWLMVDRKTGRLRSELAGLVGVIVPETKDLFTKQKRIPLVWLRLDELTREAEKWGTYRPPLESWVVGMPELKTFDLLPHLSRRHPHFLPLRPLMQAAQWHDDLKATVEKLARHAWYRWRLTQRRAWRHRAYALAAEVRAYEDDPTAIVALLPSHNFKRFLKEGDALCYQRSPFIFHRQSEGEPCQIKGVWEIKEASSSPKGYGDIVIGLPLLRHDFGQDASILWIDWREVLLRAGRKHELAQLLWLFSRELLPPLPRSDWEELQAARALDEAMDQLFIAYYFYNLLDPWRWREGRYPFYIQFVQRSLWDGLQGILREEKARHDWIRHYTEGLLAWYGQAGCPSNEDIPCHLRAMITHFRRFLEALHGKAVSGPTRHRQQIAETFIDLAQYLLDPDQSQLPPLPGAERQETPGLYRHLASLLAEPVFFTPISPFFVHILSRYHALRRRWQQINLAFREGAQLSRADLQALLDEYHRLARGSFALYHEKAILNWLFQRDQTRIENLMKAIGGQPVIQFQVLNPWVIRGQDEMVTVRVTNVGTQTAFGFHLKAITFSEWSVQPVGEAMSEPMDLPPHGAREAQWRVRAFGDPLEIRLTYAYDEEGGGRHEASHALELPVRGRRRQRALIIANPYRAGTPVSGADLFVGREAILRAIFSRLLAGNTQPILLRGPRRMGKTSILRQIQWLRQEGRHLAALGLERDQIAFIQRQVMVTSSLQEITAAHGDPAPAFFHHVLRQIHQQARIPKPEPSQDALGVFPAVGFSRILDHWIHAYIQAPVVILLDEWDELYREVYQDLARNLRAILEHPQLESVNWIISSTWVMVREVAQFGSPFYNQTYNIEVGPLSWDAARRLVIRPSDRVGVDWQGEAVVAALQQTGRRPFLLQLLCSKALDQLSKGGGARREALITVDLLRRASSEILHDVQFSHQHFGFLWEGESSRLPQEDQVDAVGRLILWVLTEHYPRPLSTTEILDEVEDAFREQGFEPLPLDFIQERFQLQIQFLHPIFDAIHQDEKGRYTLSIPLIYDWLKERLASYGDQETLIRHLYESVWEAYRLAHTGGSDS